MPSDAVFLQVIMGRLRAARAAGNDTEVQRVLAYAEAEGRPTLRKLCERMLRDHDSLDALAGVPGVHVIDNSDEADTGDEGACDFCTGSPTVAYYPFEAFSIPLGYDEHGHLHLFESGDRMFACTYCHELIEAGDWRRMREWGQPRGGVRKLWAGFRRRRTGPAVLFRPGENPEAGRSPDSGG